MSDYRRRAYRFSLHGQRWFEYRRRSRRRPKAGRERPFKFDPGDTISLEPIIEAENLLAVCRQMERESGQAPGADGVRFDQLGRRERADVFRQVSGWLRQGKYRPGPARYCDIPKAAGGTRTLSIRSIVDRVVSKAVLIAVQPVVDSRLSDHSMGFRPGRSVERLLAELEAATVQHGRWTLVTDDIRKAFDSVPVESATRALCQHVQDETVAQLIATIIRGHASTHRQIGIAQGDPLSPMALNALLDQVLDRPLAAACPGIPYWRYADNLVWCCQDVSEGHRVLHQARQLLDAAGFALKGDSGPVDLGRQGAHAELLGFRICRLSETQLRYELTRESWRSLRQSLIEAHEVPNPARMADMVIGGWLEAYGPAFGDDQEREILDRAGRFVTGAGFRECFPWHRMTEVARKAGERWRSIRHAAFSQTTEANRPREPISHPGSRRAPRAAEAPLAM